MKILSHLPCATQPQLLHNTICPHHCPYREWHRRRKCPRVRLFPATKTLTKAFVGRVELESDRPRLGMTSTATSLRKLSLRLRPKRGPGHFHVVTRRVRLQPLWGLPWTSRFPMRYTRAHSPRFWPMSSRSGEDGQILSQNRQVAPIPATPDCIADVRCPSLSSTASCKASASRTPRYRRCLLSMKPASKPYREISCLLPQPGPRLKLPSKPVYGLIFLYRFREEYTDGREDCPPNVWFANQVRERLLCHIAWDALPTMNPLRQ